VIESRSREDAVEIEQRDASAAPVIAGRAIVYYDGTPATEYRMAPDVVERIMPGAVTKRSLGADLFATYNHDKNAILGCLSAKTLRVELDERGMTYEIDAPDTSAGRDVVVSLKRGDVRGSSFRFRVLHKDDFIRFADGDYIREIKRFDRIVDVGPVVDPAYVGATSEARSAERVREACAAIRAATRARMDRRHKLLELLAE